MVDLAEALLKSHGRPWSEFFDYIEKTNPEYLLDLQDKKTTRGEEVNLLPREDIHIYGLYPVSEPFYTVVCEICEKIVKPQALTRHFDNHPKDGLPIFRRPPTSDKAGSKLSTGKGSGNKSGAGNVKLKRKKPSLPSIPISSSSQPIKTSIELLTTHPSHPQKPLSKTETPCTSKTDSSEVFKQEVSHTKLPPKNNKAKSFVNSTISCTVTSASLKKPKPKSTVIGSVEPDKPIQKKNIISKSLKSKVFLFTSKSVHTPLNSLSYSNAITSANLHVNADESPHLLFITPKPPKKPNEAEETPLTTPNLPEKAEVTSHLSLKIPNLSVKTEGTSHLPLVIPNLSKKAQETSYLTITTPNLPEERLYSPFTKNLPVKAEETEHLNPWEIHIPLITNYKTIFNNITTPTVPSFMTVCRTAPKPYLMETDVSWVRSPPKPLALCNFGCRKIGTLLDADRRASIIKQGLHLTVTQGSLASTSKKTILPKIVTQNSHTPNIINTLKRQAETTKTMICDNIKRVKRKNTTISVGSNTKTDSINNRKSSQVVAFAIQGVIGSNNAQSDQNETKTVYRRRVTETKSLPSTTPESNSSITTFKGPQNVRMSNSTQMYLTTPVTFQKIPVHIGSSTIGQLQLTTKTSNT